MEVAIVSDSHIPDRESNIPKPFQARIRKADHVIHAGDFTSSETLTEFIDLADDFTAVHGNIDTDDVNLATTETVKLEEICVAITHGTTATTTEWLKVLSETASRCNADIGVGGHTHEVTDTVHNGVHLLNPGSVTGASPATDSTMMTLTVDNNEYTVDLHQV